MTLPTGGSGCVLRPWGLGPPRRGCSKAATFASQVRREQGSGRCRRGPLRRSCWPWLGKHLRSPPRGGHGDPAGWRGARTSRPPIPLGGRKRLTDVGRQGPASATQWRSREPQLNSWRGRSSEASPESGLRARGHWVLWDGQRDA